MIRGTTPLHIFRLPFSTENIEKLRVIYSQNNKPVVRKELRDCTLEGNTIKLKLTQEDTLELDSKFPVEIQVRVLMTGGDVLASFPLETSLYRCLEDEVL